MRDFSFFHILLECRYTICFHHIHWYPWLGHRDIVLLCVYSGWKARGNYSQITGPFT